jgi:hypothetical protein
MKLVIYIQDHNGREEGDIYELLQTQQEADNYANPLLGS